MPITEAMRAALAELRSRGAVPAVAAEAPRVVIDTNVLLDFWGFRDPEALPLLALLERGALQALRSPETEEEFAEVIGREVFGLAPDAARGALESWFSLAAPAVPACAGVLCRDPLDQKFLDLAAGGGAAYLISKDKLVIKAGRRLRARGIRALRPPEALRLLGLR